MRIALFAANAAIALLSACGGPKTGQANNAAANMSATASPPATASGSTLAVTPLPTVAPASKDAALKIMHERHEGMEGLGKSAKTIGRELKSGSPDLAAIKGATPAITNFAPKIPSLFPPGTGPDIGKTRAKAEIWQTPADFAAKAHDFQLTAQAFGAAVVSGDVNAINAKFGDLGKSCKACHDKYRAEEHH